MEDLKKHWARRWLPRLSLRDGILLIVVAAIVLGWISSELRIERERRQSMQRLRYAERELERAKDEIEEQRRGLRPDRNRPFWQSSLEGTKLSNITIASNTNAFQRASFRNCVIEDSTLIGGDASFQASTFDSAKLKRTRLQGGDCAFQSASFVAADLTNAKLIGGFASFQGSSFESATLVGATLTGDFLTSNISGARLEAADLSALTSDSLISWYFRDPPTYDSRTQFPQGFDPVNNGWRLVAGDNPAVPSAPASK